MSLPPAVRPVLERLAFVIYLALLVASIAATWLGWLVGRSTGHYVAVYWALAGLLCTRWLHVHGHARWHFAECRAAFDSTETGQTWPGPERDAQLADEVEELFTRMATEVDVWERGELRRAIASRLATTPALREQFAEKLAGNPEL